MARMVVAKCPNCGASVKLDAERDVVSCAYCGASSFIQKQGRPPPPHPPNTRVIVVPRASAAPLVAVALLGLAVVAGGVGAFVALRPTSSGPRAALPGAPSPGGRPAADARAVSSEKLSFQGRRVPMLADVNGDGAPDLVASFSTHDGKAMRYMFGAFDGKTGAPLSRTEDIGSLIHQTTAAIDKGRLFIADERGQLSAYSLRDGKKQWQTALGDRLTRFCLSPEPDSLRVVTAENRVLVIDVKAGGQRPAGDKAPCAPALTDTRPSYSPEPTGYPDATAPLGSEGWVCGGVRVMGDRNFTLADQCGPKMKTSLNAMAGMGVQSIVREGEGWVLLGAKEPGTRVPMVGYFARGKLAWSTVVPDGNPLDARTGRPDRVAIVQGAVVVPYAMNTSGAGRVAAFALDSGRRIWDVALPEGASAAEEIASTRDTVFITGRSYIAALAVKDGSRRFLLGELR